jgi:cob(I)alamin adenosyltransferase
VVYGLDALTENGMKTKGLFIIFTGNGKGKTTAAIGQALRMAGHKMRVCIIQFIKSLKNTGEAKALAEITDAIELHVIGSGFTWKSPSAEVAAAARAGWTLAREKIMSNRYDMVILDEITYLLNSEVLDETEVLAVINNRPGTMHVVITGRQASQELIAAADLVTEMKEIKHPYQTGTKASKGIEY